MPRIILPATGSINPLRNPTGRINIVSRIHSDLNTRKRGKGRKPTKHKLPVCEVTGLARYRDRHQARHGAEVTCFGKHDFKVSTFACPACHGFHLELTFLREPAVIGTPSQPTEAFTMSLAKRKRRYVLFDVENPTCGAKATPEQLTSFWNLIKREAPGIAPHDHVVVGASRYVRRKYRAAISGNNAKWVVGGDAPNGADRALIAAINVHRVARDFGELVIISGDHAFAEVARRAKALGLTIHVVTAQDPTQGSMLSRELAALANTKSFVRLESRKQLLEKTSNIHPITGQPRMETPATAA